MLTDFSSPFIHELPTLKLPDGSPPVAVEGGEGCARGRRLHALSFAFHLNLEVFPVDCPENPIAGIFRRYDTHQLRGCLQGNAKLAT